MKTVLAVLLLSLEFFDMITEDNDFIMKYDTYFFISNILMLISKRLLTFAEFILNYSKK